MSWRERRERERGCTLVASAFLLSVLHRHFMDPQVVLKHCCKRPSLCNVFMVQGNNRNYIVDSQLTIKAKEAAMCRRPSLLG